MIHVNNLKYYKIIIYSVETKYYVQFSTNIRVEVLLTEYVVYNIDTLKLAKMLGNDR